MDSPISLCDAVKKRDFDLVVYLVENGADVQTVPKDMLQLGDNYDKIVDFFKIVNYIRPKQLVTQSPLSLGDAVSIITQPP